MASNANQNRELEAVLRALMPVLEQAAIGNFERDITLDPQLSMDANELLAGVQVLLEVVRERGVENARLRQELRQARTPMELINELMEGSGRQEL
jgi:hypothetical protein